MRKVVFVFARLVKDSKAYRGKTNADIEKEIFKKIGSIPYVKQVKKVTVLDSST